MTDSFSLEGKTILVTGASSGIGRQACMSIAERGGTIVATGRDRERLEATLHMLEGKGHRGIEADLTQIPAAFGDELPSLHGALHCAGITKQVPFAFLTQKHLSEIHAINYEAPMLLTRTILKSRRIAEGGSIVFVTSIAAFSGLKALSAYSASKAALIAAARVLALEIACRGIRANCIAPGMVETPMARQAEETVSSESMDQHRLLYPLGFGQPQDVANAAVFLLSDASRWITGTTLILDGGYTCQ